MPDRPAGQPAALAAYRAEVLRWNRQINLISRLDTAGQLDGLLDQCSRALRALVGAHPGLTGGPLLYCDLGAGGGLPGFVWHHRLVCAGVPVQSWLVEPRQKRAWFLERVARHAGPPAYGVLCGRWGEVAAPGGASCPTALISLKALRLPDPEVLAGLSTLRAGSGTEPERVVIVRFHPPGETWSAALAGALAAGAPGEPLGPWQAEPAEILPVAAGRGPGASLVVTRYARRRSP